MTAAALKEAVLPPEPALTMADHAFVAALTAVVLPVVDDEARAAMLMAVARDMRPRLSDIAVISRLAFCHDAVAAGTRHSAAWRRDMDDLKHHLTRFHEWRLGRAQEALRRRKT